MQEAAGQGVGVAVTLGEAVIWRSRRGRRGRRASLASITAPPRPRSIRTLGHLRPASQRFTLPEGSRCCCCPLRLHPSARCVQHANTTRALHVSHHSAGFEGAVRCCASEEVVGWGVGGLGFGGWGWGWGVGGLGGRRVTPRDECHPGGGAGGARPRGGASVYYGGHH